MTFVLALLEVHKGIYAIFERILTSGTTKTLVDASPGGAGHPRTLAFIRCVRDKSSFSTQVSVLDLW